MFELTGQLLLGWLLADFLTGVFHWWEDRVGKESWPVIGPWIIAPNRLHHAEPLAFTHTSFWARNRASIAAAITVGCVWMWLFGPSVLLATAVIGGSVANEVHRLAHEPRKAGVVIKVLQEIGLFQSPKGHSRHHRPPQDVYYCPLTDWLNPILEAVGFWTRLERLLRVR